MSYSIKILLISAFLSCFLLLGIKHPVHQGDAPQYDLLGWNMREGNGFSYSEDAPFIPSMDREPAYPAFLSVIFFVFGHKYLPVQIFQIFIFILICIFIYLLSKESFDSRIAKYSLSLAAFCPTLISYPMFLFSETLAYLLIVLMIFSLTRAIKKPSLSRFAAAGIISGIAILCKAIVFSFFILAAVSLIFIIAGNWKKKVLSVLLFSVCCFMVITPWMLRNYYNFGKFAISSRGGKVLWMSAQKVDYTQREIKKQGVFILSESLGDKLYPDKNRVKTSDVYLADALKTNQHELELQKKGYSPVQIDDIFFKEALDKIKLHPVKYLLLRPLDMVKMLSFIYLPSLNQFHVLDNIKNGSPFLKYSVLLFKGLMRLSAYIIAVLAITGMYLKRKEWLNWYFLFLFIVYINVSYGLLFGDGRYASVLVPFYLIFASVPAANMIKRLKPRTSANKGRL
ncbi:MAG: glycosyltransferase family 39 protein [Candidatus Omnitrophica bacterium]|nr:glycosyltransferase family 39 protein [Candidatus Omnitrophota bacterium]